MFGVITSNNWESCGMQNVAMCGILVLSLVLVILLRPFLSPLEAGFFIAGTALQAEGCGVRASSFYSNDPTHWGFEHSLNVFIASAIVSIMWSVIEISLIVADLSGRIQAPQPQHFDHEHSDVFSNVECTEIKADTADSSKITPRATGKSSDLVAVDLAPSGDSGSFEAPFAHLTPEQKLKASAGWVPELTDPFDKASAKAGHGNKPGLRDGDVRVTPPKHRAGRGRRARMSEAPAKAKPAKPRRGAKPSQPKPRRKREARECVAARSPSQGEAVADASPSQARSGLCVAERSLEACEARRGAKPVAGEAPSHAKPSSRARNPFRITPPHHIAVDRIPPRVTVRKVRPALPVQRAQRG
eukprot:gene23496-31601_t